MASTTFKTQLEVRMQLQHKKTTKIIRYFPTFEFIDFDRQYTKIVGDQILPFWVAIANKVPKKSLFYYTHSSM